MAEDAAAMEKALVRAGWELVDVLGALGAGQSQRLFERRWTAERDRAERDLTPLKTGPSISGATERLYRSPANWTRFRRTIDFVRPGERLFEIGLGRGYLAGIFLRDGQVGAYHGIDLEPDNVSATRETLELNGLADRAEVRQGDLYDLTRDEVAEFGADLVVCCEVIEHVPDPEAAVKTLAAALPDDADLLISVPLLGRLENVWGHVALFDAQRIRAMVEGAGLTTHLVDVVDNTWAFVLASHRQGPNARAAAAAAASTDPWADVPADPELPRALRRVDLELAVPSRWNRRLAHSEVRVQDGAVLCSFTGEDRSDGPGQYGGAAIPVADSLGIRLELALDDIDDVEVFYVDAYAESKRVARWKWEPGARRPRSNPATFVLRKGRKGLNFVPLHVDDLSSADTYEVFARIKPGSSVQFRITRAAVLTNAVR
ncbi:MULTISPECIES: class I SAM-dependent methyltransferase [Thermocrispum]|mgnify:CR=1 FL=1|jgi:2-polyprenyl-3-methyl-5-hydroxy-6-metoxy-1,4-benzoquinol methylase|nr:MULTISPECIES: class I SAM-dependent methyltransferase [Thermocrispum]